MATNINEKPIFYFDDMSPAVRSCLILIKMLDIDVELKHVDLFKGEQFETNFLELNPLHTVPTLVHKSLILTDSHVILLYLAENYEKKDELVNQLMPKQDNDRMRVFNMLFFECSVLFRRDSDMMSEIIQKGYEKTDILYHQRKILEIYNVLEKYLSQQHYMATNYMTLADISIISTLSTVELIIPIEVEKLPLLSNWLKRMKSIPEYDINLTGLEKLCRILQKMGNFKLPLKNLK